ncbi:MAG: SnoaL-like polyketide cyclase [Frankiales bacterium]|jgi:ketosteroid isomerase-like protein|nr:SnoaL-like polyketide cyclase [Frankiales bacterium]
MITFKQAFPDAPYEPVSQLESGDVAVDEGYLAGTHTGVLSTPEGDVAPTGRSLRLRSCDVLTVKGGKAVSHRFYFDQLDLVTQLGLPTDTTVVLPDAQRTPAPAR